MSQAWKVPVRIEDVPETGRKFNLDADAATRAAIAQTAGIEGLPRLQAELEVFRHGEGLRVTGVVSGRLQQLCVVTLDPIENELSETVDLIFLPAADSALPDAWPQADLQTESPEPLMAGAVDLGAIATEAMVLGLDPYPRKPGATFSPQRNSDDDIAANPFAALAALKKSGDDC